MPNSFEATPEEFMEWVKAGCEVVPTDKSYKAYIHGPHGQKKFYYENLSAEQAEEFTTLLHAGKINVGIPGYFYSGVHLPAINKTWVRSIPEVAQEGGGKLG